MGPDKREPLDPGRADPMAIGQIRCTGNSEGERVRQVVSGMYRTAFGGWAIFIHRIAITLIA